MKSLRSRFLKFSLIFLGLLALAPAWAADLQLASPFTDHMVLQRNQPVPVWGWSEPGVAIEVQFGSQSKTGTTSSEGTWRIDLDPLPASTTPAELVITTSNGETLLRKDVVVGEVWICSGQSNMQMPVAAVPEVKALSATAKNLRSFQVKQTVAFTEQPTCEGEWQREGPDSAVAFAFAHFLEQAAEVPVGIILTAWGSSSIEAWMPRDMTETVPHFKKVMERFDADSDTQKKLTAVLEGPKPWSRQDDVFLRRQPNILYNAMMAPLAPYACQGLVWYQGERNTQSIHGLVKAPWSSYNSGMLKYGKTLTEWITRYRREWGHEDMHFLIAMLPGYGKTLKSGPKNAHDHPAAHSWSWMREVQLQALNLPHTGVANTIDLGHIKDIHPKDKLPIGRRLALLAERDTLGKPIVAEGPMLAKAEVVDDTLVIHFKNAAELQTTDGTAPTAFWVADDTGTWVPAEAEIVDQTVILTSPELATPRYVRYAFAGFPAVNLVNGVGLPAYPFRTDEFAP